MKIISLEVDEEFAKALEALEQPYQVRVNKMSKVFGKIIIFK